MGQEKPAGPATYHGGPVLRAFDKHVDRGLAPEPPYICAQAGGLWRPGCSKQDVRKQRDEGFFTACKKAQELFQDMLNQPEEEHRVLVRNLGPFDSTRPTTSN